MSHRLIPVRIAHSTCLALAGVLASVQSASAQSASAHVLLAQTGTVKTLIGWAIVLLCIGLGLLVVCRPSARRSSGK
jgi:hypothetical protein